MKEKKASNRTKFSRADAMITKWFEGLKKEVGDGGELVGLFVELRACLVSEVWRGKG